MSLVTRLYGLSVRSQVPLHQERPAPDGAPVDLDLTLAPPAPLPCSAPPGRVLLDLRGSRHFYTATEHDGGFLLRFHETCDVEIDPTLTRATVRPAPGVEPDLLAVLVGGTVLAFVLAMRGHAVLHASAVEVDGRVLAFVGPSGMGKSTTATLLCAEGARLVTDDVLRVDRTGTAPTCALGATELRLRAGAEPLTGRFAAARLRTTADARRALAVVPSTTDDLPLAALVVPLPDRARRRVEVTRLPPAEALVALSQFPRLLGWRDAGIRRTGFHQLADVVDRVPVHVARLPWGPPFHPDTGRDLVRALGLDEPARARA